MSKSHLRGLGLEGRLASEALEDNRAEGPEVGLGIVLQRHDHLWSLKQVGHWQTFRWIKVMNLF